MYLETDALDHAPRVAHEVCNGPPPGFVPDPGKHAGVARPVVQKFYGERGGSRIIEMRAINSSNRDRNSFRTGELFVLL